jgi:hypothetical protein
MTILALKTSSERRNVTIPTRILSKSPNNNKIAPGLEEDIEFDI